MSELISLLYASTATIAFSQADLVNLLQKAHTNNQALGITGILLYRNKNFLQVLEGPRTAVQTIFDKILQDPRHRAIEVLLQEPIATRQFGEWAMGFQNLDQTNLADLPGFSEFLHDQFDDAAFRQNPRRVNVFLMTFKEHMR